MTDTVCIVAETNVTTVAPGSGATTETEKDGLLTAGYYSGMYFKFLQKTDDSYDYNRTKCLIVICTKLK